MSGGDDDAVAVSALKERAAALAKGANDKVYADLSGRGALNVQQYSERLDRDAEFRRAEIRKQVLGTLPQPQPSWNDNRVLDLRAKDRLVATMLAWRKQNGSKDSSMLLSNFLEEHPEWALRVESGDVEDIVEELTLGKGINPPPVSIDAETLEDLQSRAIQRLAARRRSLTSK